MRYLLALVAILFAQVVMGCEQNNAVNDRPCENDAMSIFLPESELSPAPNIRLEHFQHARLDGALDVGVSHDDLMKLHSRVKEVAASAFSSSKTSFEVMVRYTLRVNGPADFEMRTTGGEAEYSQLRKFHDAASALKDFQSLEGTSFVVFHYVISPMKSKKVRKK